MIKDHSASRSEAKRIKNKANRGLGRITFPSRDPETISAIIKLRGVGRSLTTRARVRFAFLSGARYSGYRPAVVEFMWQREHDFLQSRFIVTFSVTLALISIGFDFSRAISALVSIKVNFVPKGDRDRPRVDLKRPEKLLDTRQVLYL